MSSKAVARLRALLGDDVLETSAFRGDDEALIAPAAWLKAARALKDDAELAMDQFVDLTAVDYPEREGSRFDVVLFMRSFRTGQRIKLKARIADEQPIASVTSVWAGADWAEREAFDMFGIRFEGHPNLKRILMYDEFVGHPLRKDYPIDRVQPLVEYRDVDGTDKLAPFGPEEGQPWSRVDWIERLRGRDIQVSPAIGTQQEQRPTLSKGQEYAGAAPADE